ncbi:hypothetical protein QCA50_013327 [Cerrena zonata]|uniref:Uncharacterized protein n=1 Tax=Cerrena zonata TaxID=2478898 RepID=A0AAW0G0Q9_9APHY
MYKFTSSHNVLLGNVMDFSIARKDGSEFHLILSRSTGFTPTQQFARLNSTSPRFQPLTLSKEGRPCIWLDVDYERDPREFANQGAILEALLEAQPRAPIRLTGRKRTMSGVGGEREAVEVEVMLEEDELARCCYYCGSPENDWDGDNRFRRLTGEGYESTYRCLQCDKIWPISRYLGRKFRIHLF